MRRTLPLLLLMTGLLGARAEAQDEGLEIPPPPPTEEPATGVSAGAGLSAPTGAAPGTADGQVAAEVTVTAPSGAALELAVQPLLGAAEADLAAQRNALALARATLVVEILPDGVPLRVRAEGLSLLATQRMQPGAQTPTADEVLAPLVAQADLDLRGGQALAALPKLDLVLARLPEDSTLRAQAAQLRGMAASMANPGPTPYPPAPSFSPWTPPQPTAPPEPPRDPTLRGTGEIVELYITAGMFGLLTGAYIPFVASEDMATPTTYTLTMIGGGAVMAMSVLLLDLTTQVRTGVAPTISSSIRLGFVNGMLGLGIYGLDASMNDPGISFTLAWGGAAFGALTGIAVGFGLEPSVREERFVESVGLWGGVLGTAIALITDYQDPIVGLALTMIGLDAGILAGIISAASGAAPSTRRTLFADLGFVVGAGVGAALPMIYYAYSGDAVEFEALGVGMLIGSIGGWALMFGLIGDDSEPAGEEPQVQVGLAPVEGGGAVSLSGTF